MRNYFEHHAADMIIKEIKKGSKELWIQSAYKCSSSTIYKYKKQLGLIKRPQKLNDTDICAIRELRHNGKLKTIAVRFGVSMERISKICRSHYTNCTS